MEGTIFRLAVPAVLAMAVAQLYAICDLFFLAGVGFASVGGVCYPVTAVLQGVVMTFSFGSANKISTAIGSGDVDGARGYFSTGFAGLATVSVLLGLVVLVWAKALAVLCGGGSCGDVGYMAVQGAGLVIFGVYFFLSAVLRAEGKAGIVMISAVSGLVGNFAFNYIFVNFLGFGVVAIGIATLLGECVAILLLGFGCKNSEVLKFSFANVGFSKFFGVVWLGSSSFFRQLMGAVSALALNYVCRQIGGNTLGGVTVSARISVLVFAVALGISQGMQPVMAFWHGKNNGENIAKALKFTLILAVLASVVLGGVQFAFARQIVGWFGNIGSANVNLATKILRVSAFSLPASFFSVVVNMAFQARGKAVLNIAISLLRQGVVFLPVLGILFFIVGENAVVWSHFVADTITAVIILCFLCVYFAKKR